ncbi:hypothetical protein ACK35E_19385 [Aeromonas veronii]|uniref:hypothetical protein n=1 Tax=unclassified Aeromonas TaxID=257493 RepID=UPI003A2F5B42
MKLNLRASVLTVLLSLAFQSAVQAGIASAEPEVRVHIRQAQSVCGVVSPPGQLAHTFPELTTAFNEQTTATKDIQLQCTMADGVIERAELLSVSPLEGYPCYSLFQVNGSVSDSLWFRMSDASERSFCSDMNSVALQNTRLPKDQIITVPLKYTLKRYNVGTKLQPDKNYSNNLTLKIIYK